MNIRYRLQGREVEVTDLEGIDAGTRALLAAEAEFLDSNGDPLVGSALTLMRRFFERESVVPPSALSDSRWLIPGLQRIGTIPMLGGNPKAGKSTLGIDLAASLLVEGRRFLNHFPPAELTADPRHESLYVWLINAETPRADYEEALAAAGLLGHTWLDVVHLEEWGGAAQFDLTDSRRWDEWARQLIECNECDGSDFWTPSYVIVDGLTAILAEAGKGTEAVGLWGAQFRRLLRASDVPSGLVIGHNTLKGSHLMGGVEAQAGWDGLWNYWSSDPDNPRSARYFNVIPRLGGVAIPQTRVSLGEDGRLTLHAAKDEAGPAAPASDSSSVDDEVLAAVVAAMPDGVRQSVLTGGGRVGVLRRDAVQRLADAGKIHSRQHGPTRLWFLSPSE